MTLKHGVLYSSSHDATIRITRDHDLLNVKVYKKFRLKTLGFSEWLEVQVLTSKTVSKSNGLLLQSLRAKFDWVISQAKKLGLSPPTELAHYGKPAEEKKRKRTEIHAEVFVKENIVVDGMQRNLIPPPGVEEVMKGPSECKASKSNFRRIQVKDIVKEVEDYLKTYSSDEEQAELKLFSEVQAGKSNNLSWRDKRVFELKPVPSTKLIKVVNS
ncbi:hypothetical protein Tco_1098476 [Tanacetum coccineum]